MRASFVLAICSLVLAAGRSSIAFAAEGPPRPNILWLTTEDIGPQLGC